MQKANAGLDLRDIRMDHAGYSIGKHDRFRIIQLIGAAEQKRRCLARSNGTGQACFEDLPLFLRLGFSERLPCIPAIVPEDEVDGAVICGSGSFRDDLDPATHRPSA